MLFSLFLENEYLGGGLAVHPCCNKTSLSLHCFFHINMATSQFIEINNTWAAKTERERQRKGTWEMEKQWVRWWCKGAVEAICSQNAALTRTRIDMACRAPVLILSTYVKTLSTFLFFCFFTARCLYFLLIMTYEKYNLKFIFINNLWQKIVSKDF